jgi:hypothetical protein
VLDADLGGVLHLVRSASQDLGEADGGHGTSRTDFPLAAHLGAGDGRVLLVEATATWPPGIFCLFLERLSNVEEHVGEHAALLCAIAEGDADGLAREHVFGFDRAIRVVT